MKSQTALPLLAIAVVALAAGACSSSAPPNASSAMALAGTYDAMSDGNISRITFYDAGRYELTLAACDGSLGVCTQSGAYVLNDAHDVLSLTDSATGQSKAIAFQVLMLPVEPFSSAPAPILGELDVPDASLVGAGGGLSGGGQSLYTSGIPLVQSFTMSGQRFQGNGEVIRPFDHCDPAGPCPDLRLNSADLAGSIFIETRNVSQTSCSVNEGTILAPGLRRLLRFSTSATNIGTGDLFLGNPATGDPRYFEFAACHGHYHFKGYADYELLNPDGTVAVKGHKESFCIEDNIQGSGRSLPPRPLEPLQGQPPPPDVWTTSMRTYCHHPGLHKGWTDAYYNTTEGNWIDVTGLPPGDYVLSVTINPQQMIGELSYDNNHAEVPVHLPDPSADGAACPADSDAIFRCNADGSARTKCLRGSTTTAACAHGCGQPQEIAHPARCL